MALKVIKGNKELAKEWLEWLWEADRNNAIVESYTDFRSDNISIAQKVTKGHNDGTVYVVNFDDCFVLETEEDMYYFSLNDDEWLEYVSDVSCREIAEWLDNDDIGHIDVGDKIRIINMKGEPRYTGKEGVVEYIDDIGQLHGTWGGCAIIPNEDEFIIIEKASN